MLAPESSGIQSSLGLRVNTESVLETFFTGRAFINETIMSFPWRRSIENKLALLSKVLNDLKTLIALSTKLLYCSLPCLGRITHAGQELFMAMDLKVACASVIISSGCEYLINRTCNADINDLLLRSCVGMQKKYPVAQSSPKIRARLHQSLFISNTF